MLSRDELSYGITFVLKLWDTAGVPFQWIETFRGDMASHWYDIYRSSDWEALRREASDVFHRGVTEAEAETARTSRTRCIYIHTDSVKADELTAGKGSG